MTSFAEALPFVVAGQGIYYTITGAWPLVSIRSFLKVTGPKTDIWLVKTVGGLIVALGIVFLVAALRGHLVTEILLLSCICAFALAVVDTYYVLKGTISPVYITDAAAELLLLGFIMIAALEG
jgi:hypothetical protein